MIKKLSDDSYSDFVFRLPIDHKIDILLTPCEFGYYFLFSRYQLQDLSMVKLDLMVFKNPFSYNML